MLDIKRSPNVIKKKDIIKQRIVSYLKRNKGGEFKSILMKKFLVKSMRLPYTSFYADMAIKELYEEGVLKKKYVRKNKLYISLSYKREIIEKEEGTKFIQVFPNVDFDTEGNKIKLISDLHFTRDFRSTTYCEREGKHHFGSPAHMNERIIFNWNKNVDKEDTVFVLGDNGISSYLQHLNGKKIYVQGNHDVQSSADIIILMYKKVRFVLVHNPYTMKVINDLLEDDLTWVVHGHFHNGTKTLSGGNTTNVSADLIGFVPITLESIYQDIIKTKSIHNIISNTIKYSSHQYT